MAEEGLLFGDRVWFYDTRTAARRMAVSSHPENGIIVVSFWQGDTCTATFRLQLTDAARLISALAEGMASGLPTGHDQPTPRPTPTGWRRCLALVHERIHGRSKPHLRVIR